jgi:hypothetical protein
MPLFSFYAVPLNPPCHQVNSRWSVASKKGASGTARHRVEDSAPDGDYDSFSREYVISVGPDATCSTRVATWSVDVRVQFARVVMQPKPS